MDWHPMSEHVFPWDNYALLVKVFDRSSGQVDILQCTCGEHGALFDKLGTPLSIHEENWVPFAWCVDDSPKRDDDKYPPLWFNYLTNPEIAP